LSSGVCVDTELINYLLQCRGAGAAATINIGIYQDGTFGAQTESQLQRLKAVLA